MTDIQQYLQGLVDLKGWTRGEESGNITYTSPDREMRFVLWPGGTLQSFDIRVWQSNTYSNGACATQYDATWAARMTGVKL